MIVASHLGAFLNEETAVSDKIELVSFIVLNIRDIFTRLNIPLKPKRAKITLERSDQTPIVILLEGPQELQGIHIAFANLESVSGTLRNAGENYCIAIANDVETLHIIWIWIIEAIRRTLYDLRIISEEMLADFGTAVDLRQEEIYCLFDDPRLKHLTTKRASHIEEQKRVCMLRKQIDPIVVSKLIMDSHHKGTPLNVWVAENILFDARTVKK